MTEHSEILSCFAKQLEHVLAEHLGRFSEQLHEQLVEHEANLKKMSSKVFCMEGPDTEDDPACAVGIQIDPGDASDEKIDAAPHLQVSNEQNLQVSPPRENLLTLASSLSSHEQQRKESAQQVSTPQGEATFKQIPNTCWLHRKIVKLEANPLFERFFLVLIALNTAVVVAQLQTATDQRKLMEELSGFQMSHHVFTIFFILEIVTRIFARGIRFFVGNPSFGWDMFDLLIVMSSAAEMVIQFSFQIDAQQSLTLRIVRLARLVTRASRLVRIFRLTKAFAPLRVLLTSILYSFRHLVWVVILMMFGLLVFAILFTSAALDYLITGERKGIPLAPQEVLLEASYGSLAKSLLTEYMAITGDLIGARPSSCST